MSHADRISESGRQPVQIVEMDLDFCANVYGTAPCTAAVGVTGTAKCFNTRKTCQDSANYSGATDIANTWNPADKDAVVTLSGGNLIATHSDFGGVRATIGKSTGKWYFEVTITSKPDASSFMVIGISRLTTPLSYPGNDANGVGIYSSTGYWIKSGVFTSYPGSDFTTGDIISVLYNADTGTLAFWKNGVTCGDIASGLTGTLYPHVGFQSLAPHSNIVTANFGGASFSYVPPADYRAWKTATGRRTYRFSNLTIPPSSDLDFIAIPAVSSVSDAPTVIDPINGIGKRASVVVTFKDFAHSDDGIDPYLSGRGYDSTTRSTFWLKLLARNPYYQNRPIRVKTGYVVDGEAPDAANFEERLYLIQKIAGPDMNGVVRVTAQDPLKLLDDDRAKTPATKTGKLLTAISAGALAATLTPAGIGDLEYAASGTMAMGSELATFTRVGDAITFIARGVNGTGAFPTADAHGENEPMQQCTVYSGQTITAILHDLLVNAAGIDASYINLTEWDAEEAMWLSDYTVGTTIAKPIGVNQLVQELAQQCLFYVWWDERAQKIKFRAIRPATRDAVTSLNDTSHVIESSQSRTEKPEARKSQIHVYHGQRDPVVDLEKPWNFLNAQIVVDPDSEGANEYGDSRILQIFSRWLPTNSTSEAEKLGLRLLNRYRDNPISYKLKLDAKDSALWTGDIVSATIRSIIDFSGGQVATDLQILEVKETVPGSEFEYTLQDTQFRGRYAFWAPDATPAFASATDDEKRLYGFWSKDDGLLTDGSKGYQYV